jgi:hypothetical protein
MIWLVVAVGLILAVFGAVAGGALIALSRSELASSLASFVVARHQWGRSDRSTWI